MTNTGEDQQGVSQRQDNDVIEEGSRGEEYKTDDERNTAGGLDGQFSDKERGDEAEWSPGSGRSADR